MEPLFTTKPVDNVKYVSQIHKKIDMNPMDCCIPIETYEALCLQTLVSISIVVLRSIPRSEDVNNPPFRIKLCL